MTTPRDDIDGRIGEGWSGDKPNGSHINLVLARRGSPTAAALMTTLTAPAPGHTPVLVCVGPREQDYEPVWPPTLMMNKATATEDAHQTMTWGAAQLGIGQGVLDAVADGLLEPDHETIVFVAVWVDPRADDERAVRDANREAVHEAVTMAVRGRPRTDAERLVRDRDSLTNPFYGGG